MLVGLKNIGHRFGPQWLFRNLNAEFEDGRVHAVIGANGAGKSTLAQIIAGFVRPLEGLVLGPNPELARDEVAICAPWCDLFDELSVQQCIEFQLKVKPTSLGVTVSQMLHEIELESHAEKSVHQLSSGMRQRLKLALALSADCQLLVLDEPFTNLDARWTAWFQQSIRQSTNKCVVIASNSVEAEMALITGASVSL